MQSAEKFVKGKESLIDVLEARAMMDGDKTLYWFLDPEKSRPDHTTFLELHNDAARVAAWLQGIGAARERVVLLLPPGLGYIRAFMGCVYAGATAVPAYPPNPRALNRSVPRLKQILVDSGTRYIITTPALKLILQSTLGLLRLGSNLQKIEILALKSEIDASVSDWRRPEIDKDDLMFLQYTSGSTSAPKGVMVTHGNIMHNLSGIYKHFGHSSESRGVIWLPPYHDMGLIGGILQPLYAGFPSTLMSPFTFLQDPMIWLSEISKAQGRITSGGPNFAYELCLRRITAEQKSQLDLSRWEVAFNGSEPIQPDTLKAFASGFASTGFKASAFYPCYGLAESTLIVTGPRRSFMYRTLHVAEEGLKRNEIVITDPHAPGSKELVSSGGAVDGQKVRIVDPETCVAKASGIGEVWIMGPSVAGGYWHNKTASSTAFAGTIAGEEGDVYMRSGDLGFLHDGELFVTGRIKDIIIIGGKNYYPQDIEVTVQDSADGLRKGCGAAFSVDAAGGEQLVIVQEFNDKFKTNPGQAIDLIRKIVTAFYSIKVTTVVLIKPRSIPKTSSGKIQRKACRELFLTNKLSVIEQWSAPSAT